MSAWRFFEGDGLFVPAAHHLHVGESIALVEERRVLFGSVTTWRPMARVGPHANRVQGEPHADLAAAKRAAVELLSTAALAEVTRLHTVARACNALLAGGDL